jgi:CBS domain-containing protein
MSGFQPRRLTWGNAARDREPAVQVTKIKGTGTMTTTVADVMTIEVATIRATAGYKEIAVVLRRHGVSALPVVDAADRVIGVVSDSDLLDGQAARRLATGAIRLAWQLRQWSATGSATAADLMTAPAVTVGAGAPMAEAARLMQVRQLRRLPVVDHRGQIVGIISRADLLSVFERPDELIRDQVLTKVVGEAFGLDMRAFQVAVSSGYVTISGPVPHRSTALRLVGAVWQVDGVVGVRDRLSYRKDEKVDTRSVSRFRPIPRYQKPAAGVPTGLD